MNDYELDEQGGGPDVVGDPTSNGTAKLPRGIGNLKAELHAMQALLETLEPLSAEAQLRSIEWLIDALDLQIDIPQPVDHTTALPAAARPPSADTPKAFISAKKPSSAAERIACLAYYLAHHRQQETFKRADIVQLNTEAASIKFGNPSRDLGHAEAGSGYVVAAGPGGLKQITPRGEALVEALPNRDAVTAALKDHPFKRRRPSPSRKPAAPGDES